MKELADLPGLQRAALAQDRELAEDGLAAVWIREAAADQEAMAEQLAGLCAVRTDGPDNDAFAELAAAHRAAAGLLKWRADRAAQRHRGEADKDSLPERIKSLAASLAFRVDNASALSSSGQIVPAVLQSSIARMRQDLAWLEQLQQLTAGPCKEGGP